MASDKTLKLSIWIAGKVDKTLTSAVNIATSSLNQITATASRVGTIGLAAMGALAVGTAAAINDCTDAAKEYEKDMADVVKYVDGLADKSGKISENIWGKDKSGNNITFLDNYEKVKDIILDLSTQIPLTAKDLTRLAAAAGQSGKGINDLFSTDAKGNIGGFLKDIAMVATAMDITADQAGDWGAKWEKSLSMSHGEIMVLFDQINYLGANSATTAAEIASVVNEVASLGQVAGMDPAATAAMADAMLAMGVDTGVASTSINRMFVNMSKGVSATKRQKEAWKELGFTAAGVAKDMQANAAGTIQKVLEEIGKLPAERRVSVLNDLFGQWAIKGAAKMTGNLQPYIDALNMVNDANLYSGSMEREFIIKASTSAAIDTRMGNSVYAFREELGESFLPAKKQLSLTVIDIMDNLRKNMPQLSQLANKFAAVLSKAITTAAERFEQALPTIERVLDYLLNNGDKVVDTIKKLAIAFAAMKVSPQIVGVASGLTNIVTSGIGIAGPLARGRTAAGGKKAGGIFGGLKKVYSGGQRFAGGISTSLQAASTGASLANSSLTGGTTRRGLGGLVQRASNGIIGGIFGIRNRNKIANPNLSNKVTLKNVLGMATQITGAKQSGGLHGMLWRSIAGSKTGQYIGNIGKSVRGVAHTKIGSSLIKGVKAVGSTGGQILSGISNATGLTGLGRGIKNTAVAGANWLGGKAQLLGMNIAGSRPVQAIGGAAKAVMHSGPMQGIATVAKAVPSALGNVFSFIGSGMGAAGSAFAPFVSGFASILSGALPIVGVISSIIAVVSILGDNLDGIRNIIGKVFGDKGLEVFDNFMEKLSGIGKFISGLFEEGGVAKALAPLREGFAGLLDSGGFLSTLFGGKENGLAAFDGITTIVQSIMGVVGQLVDFSINTVKPIIQDIFAFITQTVVPKIIQIFTACAPTIGSIISSIGSAVMTVAGIIASVIQILEPVIAWIINAILNFCQVAIPAILGYFDVFIQAIESIIANIKGVFEGIVTFISGVFSGNWEKAWEGIKQIFGNVFEGIVTLFKTPVNAVIKLINKAIEGINGLGLDIPDWVPLIGGKKFSINIPTIPMLAKGGFTTGPSIAGEAGKEAVISFQSGVREKNIDIWAKAGRLLGVNRVQAAGAIAKPQRQMLSFGSLSQIKPIELKEIEHNAFDNRRSSENITFAPHIEIHGNASDDVIDYAISEMKEQFMSWYQQMKRKEKRTAY